MRCKQLVPCLLHPWTKRRKRGILSQPRKDPRVVRGAVDGPRNQATRVTHGSRGIQGWFKCLAADEGSEQTRCSGEVRDAGCECGSHHNTKRLKIDLPKTRTLAPHLAGKEGEDTQAITMVIHNLWSLLGLCCWLYPQICSLSTSPHLLLPSVPSSNVYLVTSLLEPGWSVAAVGSAQTKPVTRPQSGSCAMSWQQFRVCTLHKTRPCARLVPSPCTPGSLLVDLRVECQPGEGRCGEDYAEWQ